MGRLKFILGPSGAGKSWYMYESVIRRSMENPQKNYILVVPEQFTLETQKKIVTLHPRGAVANIDIVSFNRFALRVFDEVGLTNPKVLDDTGKSLILRKVIDVKQKELHIYRDKVHMHGFVEEMKSVISELYMYDIATEKCQEMQEKVDNPFLKEKLRDISVIYDAFSEYIREKFITKEQLLDKFAGVVEKSERVRESEIYFDGFTGFTPVQNRLMRLFLRYAKEVWVTITIGSEQKRILEEEMKKGRCTASEQELFKMSKDTINLLLKMYGEEGGDFLELVKESVFLDGRTQGRFLENEELAHLERQLFRGKSKKRKSGGTVELFHFQTSAQETEYVTDYIADQVKKGMRYRDFAIIAGDIGAYGKILQDQFKIKKIPYFMDNKRSLVLNPAVLFLRGLIQMVVKDFSYESVFHFLRCGIHVMEEEKVDIFENYVLACGIRGRKKYQEPFVYRQKRMTDEELVQINEIRQEFMDKIRDCLELRNGTVREITAQMYGFLQTFEVEQYLSGMETKFLEMGELSLGKEYGQTYAYIIDLLDKLVELLGEEEISLKEYGEILDAGFEEIKVGVIPLGTDQVIAGDIERTRLNDVKVLFVLNANDGCIPKHSHKSSLLSQNDRNYLKKMEIELSPTIRENIFIQKFYLYLNLTKPSGKLCISYVDSDTEKKAARPSYLINEIEKLYEGMERRYLEETKASMYLSTEEYAFSYLARRLNRNHLPEMTAFEKELYSYFYQKEEYEERIETVRQGIFFGNNATNLSRMIAEKLAGNLQVKSITRLERYAACAYAHFLSYSLQLEPRQRYQVSLADMGTLYHKTIELFSGEMVRRSYDFRTITEEKRDALVEECVKKVTENYGNTVLKSSSRNEYLIRKISAVCKKTVWAICEHVKRGKYTPQNFEFAFRDGRIDRMDTYEEDGKIYVKIIDYKSGNKKFDMSDVFNGLSMQLIYYMGEALKVKRTLEEGKEVLPGGSFYFHIKSPYVECQEKIEDEELEHLLLKEYKMSGLINTVRQSATAMDETLEEEKGESSIVSMKAKDIGRQAYAHGLNSGYYEKIVQKTEEKINQFAGEIIEGHIEKNPYRKAGMSPCDYCDYHGICGFDARDFDNRYRKLIKADKMEEIIKELGGEDADEVDKKSAGSD